MMLDDGESIFQELHQGGMLSSQAYHPGRPDGWEPDVGKAVKEHALDQQAVKDNYDLHGFKYHDGMLGPGGFAKHIKDT
jgi:hypothetical protein